MLEEKSPTHLFIQRARLQFREKEKRYQREEKEKKRRKEEEGGASWQLSGVLKKEQKLLSSIFLHFAISKICVQ